MSERKGIGSELAIVGFGTGGFIVAESKGGRGEGSFSDIWHCSYEEMGRKVMIVVRVDPFIWIR